MINKLKKGGILLVVFFNLNLTHAQVIGTPLPLGEARNGGLDQKKLDKTLLRFDNDVPSIGAVLVWKNQKLIVQRFYNGTTVNTTFDIKSASKCLLSALVGIKQTEGKFPKLNTPVYTLFPDVNDRSSKNKELWYIEFVKQQDEYRKQLTIQHLLSMQTGMLWEDNNPLIHRAFQCSSNPTHFILDLPYTQAPGQTFLYCTGACQVVSHLLYNAHGGDYRRWAKEVLFSKVGMTIAHWPIDPNNVPSGGSAIEMNAESFMRFGILFLQKGKWNNETVVAEEWINQCWAVQTQLNQWDVLPGANGYGYYWWRRQSQGQQVYVASGYGGQLICVIPSLDMVVTTLCYINEKNKGRSDIRRLHLVIDELIKNALAGAK